MTLKAKGISLHFLPVSSQSWEGRGISLSVSPSPPSSPLCNTPADTVKRVHLFGRQIHGVTDQSSQLVITAMPLHLYPNLKADAILQNFKSFLAIAALKFQNLQI